MAIFMSGGIPVQSYAKIASELKVGDIIKIKIGGLNYDFIVINQGKPSGSSIYDASCDGTWVVMKDAYEKRVWNTSAENDYKNSSINSYLNSDFYNLIDKKNAIKEVKIPYRPNSGYDATVSSGSNGLPVKVFLLSVRETGITSTNYVPEDGKATSYFDSDAKRITYLNGSSVTWVTRSPATWNTSPLKIHYVTNSGSLGGSANTTNQNAIRPALVLSYQAKLTEDNVLVG